MVNFVWWGVVPVAAVCVLVGLSVGVQGVAVAVANDGGQPGAVLRFARQYGNDMVLQAGAKGATVWGYAPPGDTVSVTVTKDRHPVINSAVQALVRRAFSTRHCPLSLPISLTLPQCTHSHRLPCAGLHPCVRVSVRAVRSSTGRSSWHMECSPPAAATNDRCSPPPSHCAELVEWRCSNIDRCCLRRRLGVQVCVLSTPPIHRFPRQMPRHHLSICLARCNLLTL
jgi:hypothetical protein